MGFNSGFKGLIIFNITAHQLTLSCRAMD